MTGHVNNPGQDPAEGSREIVERELQRSGPDRKKSGEKSAGDQRERTKADKARKN